MRRQRLRKLSKPVPQSKEVAADGWNYRCERCGERYVDHILYDHPSGYFYECTTKKIQSTLEVNLEKSAIADAELRDNLRRYGVRQCKYDSQPD